MVWYAYLRGNTKDGQKNKLFFDEFWPVFLKSLKKTVQIDQKNYNFWCSKKCWFFENCMFFREIDALVFHKPEKRQPPKTSDDFDTRIFDVSFKGTVWQNSAFSLVAVWGSDAFIWHLAKNGHLKKAAHPLWNSQCSPLKHWIIRTLVNFICVASAQYPRK